MLHVACCANLRRVLDERLLELLQRPLRVRICDSLHRFHLHMYTAQLAVGIVRQGSCRRAPRVGGPHAEQKSRAMPTDATAKQHDEHCGVVLHATPPRSRSRGAYEEQHAAVHTTNTKR
jgi:hypothetical protein